MDQGNFLTEIFKDVQGLVAPLLGLLNGVKVIVIKLFDFVASALSNFAGQ